eukprot:m.241395 g.241395  ORF g.241395 m.241395 type:complete len:828 (-) comp13839_c0_seq1:140-2623(-)
MAFVERYVRTIKRLRYVVVLFWVACIAMGAWKGFAFIAETDFTFNPPDDSLAVKATRELDTFFFAFTPPIPHGTVGGFQAVIVLLQRGNGVLGNDTEAFTLALMSEYRNDQICYDQTLPFRSYYSLMQLGFAGPAEMHLSPDGTATYIDIQADDCLSYSLYDYSMQVRDTVNRLAAQYFPHGEVEVRVTGEPVVDQNVQDAIEGDMLTCDGIAFPIALLIFCITLKSLRLVIIPVINITTALLTTFLIMYPVGKVKDIISIAPSLILSTTIAMSIDYSLFMLSRFREELADGAKLQESVIRMVESSGHTVLISGVTLSFCFAGLLLFPMELLSSLGVGCSICVAVAVLVNLTLTPSLVMIFPNFFSNITMPWPCCRKAESADSAPLMAGDDDDTPYTERPSSERDYTKSSWYKFGVHVTNHPFIVLIVALGLVGYPAYAGIEMKWTMNTLSYAPRNDEATTTFADLLDVFPGSVLPMQLLMVANSRDINLTKMYSDTHSVIQNVLLPISPAGTQVYSVVDYPNVTYALTIACQANVSVSPLCNLTRLLVTRYVSMNYYSPTGDFPPAVFADIFLGVDPNCPEGIQWLRDARSALGDAGPAIGVDFLIAGGSTYNFDTIQTVYDAFPTALGVTVAVVFVVVGVAFRSILIPLRSVFTISLTLGLVYGLATFVYEDNILNFMQLGGVTGLGALYWIPPILSFSICVGLGLDYDIFLLTRILEYRHAGMSDRQSILMGLARTGRIITAAGGIMAVAFFGLLFSRMLLLNQLSFFLVAAVLVDTLLIRTMVVPAVMVLCGRWNWWPRSMPAAKMAGFNLQSAEYGPLAGDI